MNLEVARDVKKLRPLGARVFVKPDDPAEKIGSIWVPGTAKKETGTGIVVAIGLGMRTKDGGRWPMPDGVNVGARVFFSSRNPFPRIKLDGVEYLQMYDDNIEAVVTEWP